MTVTVLLIFVPVLAIILLMLNVLLAVHRPDTEKVTPYECGFNPIYNQVRAPFAVQYYLVGILFLIFDLEIAVFYPLAVTLYQVSSYGFWIGMLFLLLLTVGFVYELQKGALYFTDHRSEVSKAVINRPNDKSDTHTTLVHYSVGPWIPFSNLFGSGQQNIAGNTNNNNTYSTLNSPNNINSNTESTLNTTNNANLGTDNVVNTVNNTTPTNNTQQLLDLYHQTINNNVPSTPDTLNNLVNTIDHALVLINDNAFYFWAGTLVLTGYGVLRTINTAIGTFTYFYRFFSRSTPRPPVNTPLSVPRPPVDVPFRVPIPPVDVPFRVPTPPVNTPLPISDLSWLLRFANPENLIVRPNSPSDPQFLSDSGYVPDNDLSAKTTNLKCEKFDFDLYSLISGLLVPFWLHSETSTGVFPDAARKYSGSNPNTEIKYVDLDLSDNSLNEGLDFVLLIFKPQIQNLNNIKSGLLEVLLPSYNSISTIFLDLVYLYYNSFIAESKMLYLIQAGILPFIVFSFLSALAFFVLWLRKRKVSKQKAKDSLKSNLDLTLSRAFLELVNLGFTVLWFLSLLHLVKLIFQLIN